MADLGSAALIISSLVGAGLQYKQSNDARRDAKKAQKKGEAQQMALQQQFQDQSNADNSAQVAAQARERQKLLAASAQGGRANVLTSPLGLTGAAPTASKSLLGS